MATPRLTSFRLGANAEVQVLSAGGPRPAVLLSPPLPDLAGRLARAGYAVVSVDAAARVAEVLAALAHGALGFTASAVGVIGGAAAPVAGVPFLEYHGDPDAAARWCAAHLGC